jgi:cation diffusion facilitator family transporter
MHTQNSLSQGISIANPTSAENSHEIRRITLIGLFINVALSVFKLIGGILGNSQALVADAAHSLSDCATDVAVLIGSYFWSAPPDNDHPYGHRRIETMVTIFIGLSVGMVGVLLTWDAITSIQSEAYQKPTLIAAIAAFVSIVVKEFLFQWTRITGKRIRSVALSANAWHHRSDAISSIPVLIAVLFSMIGEEWLFMDQVGAVVVSGFIIKAAIEIVKPGIRELADTGANESELKQIVEIAKNVEGVIAIHDLRTRFVGNDIIAEIHIEVNEKITVVEGHDIAVRVREALISQIPEVLDVLTHIDPHDDSEYNRME